MYGHTAEAAEARQHTTEKAIQRYVGPCREWPPEAGDICGAPAEYVLWGKLIPAQGLGPRCYECARRHVHHSMLEPRMHAAVIDVAELARRIDEAHLAASGSTQGYQEDA